MAINLPNSDQIKHLAASFGIELSDADARSFEALVAGMKPSYDRLDVLQEDRLPVKYPRLPGRAPSEAENPHNAWAWLCEIQGAKKGVLAGKRVAIKDNVCVAGVPMRNGNRQLEGYVPDIDATVVTRILDAGGSIAGKVVNEDLCFSGHSITSQPGVVRNPHRPTHGAGGSSSGSGAAIAAGDVTMALGGDQGGSVRIPAAWSGIVGLKATHGLVPYTGVFPIEATIDHCGPMGATVEDVARLLTAIAGPDGLDPRQVNVSVGDYLAAIKQPLKGLKIAVVSEGFNRPESDAATDKKVRAAIKELKAAGARVTEVSIPEHLDGPHIWTGIIIEGATELMIKGNSMGYSWQGYYTVSLLDAWARGWHSRPNDLPETAKMVLFMGEYLKRYYHGRFYAKSQNLRRKLRAAYDAVLAEHDVLAMPTIPFRATAFPEGKTREDVIGVALNMVGNTCPFDVSGHPAISVPCGIHEQLPIGLMLIGRSYDEATVLRAAAGLEKLGDWKTM
ncbi:MAG TPA: amidase [Kiloniellales bacterium]|nr:amidase [Kiloniellales bacterium]